MRRIGRHQARWDEPGGQGGQGSEGRQERWVRPGRRRRLRAALVAGSVAAGLLLTACSGGSGESSYDGGGSRAKDDNGFPAPGPVQPTGPSGTDDGTAEGDRKGELRESAPPADYLSTFALDVDTASYGYARRTLEEGRRPDPSTIRPEEFINSFGQNYERPDGNGFTVTVDGARTAAPDGSRGEEDANSDTFGQENRDWRFLRVGLATREAEDAGERPPAALTFVIDVSGSMAEPGRLDLVKESLGVMTERLRDDDAVALVSFSDEARTVLPMTRLGDHRGRVQDAIDTLEPTDSTNLGAGVTTGYRTAVDGLREGATNRVVLLSDALANTGETDADAILDRIADARRAHGITLFGVGVGSDYGDALMERLADKGDGHTTYVSNAEDARTVFVDQLPRNIDLTARDAKAQVSFDPETVDRFRLIGYDNRQVADEDFRDDRVDGGEIGPGHTVTALYAVRVKPGASGHVATATVRWLDPKSRVPHEETGQIETDSLDRNLWAAETGRSGLQVTAIAAYFADSLRSGGDRVDALPVPPSLSELAERADELASATESKPIRQLAETIDRATDLG
ncbi:VWA domain-containing protein [Streptomyces sp. IB201691-2A2]|uniref:vWA domain-containing protein n=1 Tax=Streptomyces sp. IB201691-2A2 TaxID=2561920 RepID=UPI00117C22CF|nr:VWA domain-containing protein [Streptomyces sp. IB201691-2A2]TRO69685.1 VWA domain-containing protein [Streptomyces sp. IB201691-2A2]